jgi:hypothetical protein
MRWVLGLTAMGLTAICITLAGCGPRVITVQGGVERTDTVGEPQGIIFHIFKGAIFTYDSIESPL